MLILVYFRAPGSGSRTAKQYGSVSGSGSTTLLLGILLILMYVSKNISIYLFQKPMGVPEQYYEDQELALAEDHYAGISVRCVRKISLAIGCGASIELGFIRRQYNVFF